MRRRRNRPADGDVRQAGHVVECEVRLVQLQGEVAVFDTRANGNCLLRGVEVEGIQAQRGYLGGGRVGDAVELGVGVELGVAVALGLGEPVAVGLGEPVAVGVGLAC